MSVGYLGIKLTPPSTPLREIVTNRLRQGGYAPKLTDRDIITMELVGEFLQMDTWTPTHKSISILNSIGKHGFPI